MESTKVEAPEASTEERADWWYSEDRFQTMEHLDGVVSDQEGGGRVPAEPLWQFLSSRSITSVAREIAARYGTNELSEARQLMRLNRKTTRYLTNRAADRFAIGIGQHPSQIWLEWR